MSSTVTALTPGGRSAPRFTFGDRLRKVRKTLGLNQAEMARRLNVGARALGAWELDTNTPRDLVPLAIAIEDEFLLPRGWMLGLDAYPATPPETPEGVAGQLLRLDSNQQPLDNCVADGHLATVLPFPSRADLNVPAATAFSQTPAIG